MHKDTNTQERGLLLSISNSGTKSCSQNKVTIFFSNYTFFLLKLEMELSSYRDNSLQESRERVTRWCLKLTNNMIKTVLPEKEFSIKIVEICANVLRAIALAKVENIMMIFFPF